MSKKQRARKEAEIAKKKALNKAKPSPYAKTLKWVGIGLGSAIVIVGIVFGFWFYSRQNVAAYVGGEKILKSDVESIFNYYLQIMQMQGATIEEGSQEWQNLWDSSCEALIQEKLALKEAHRLGLDPTEEEIQQELKDFESEQNMTEDQIKENLKAQGKTWEEFLQALSDQVLRRKIYEQVTNTVTVTATDVEDYFQLNKDTYDQTEQVAVRFLYLSYILDINGNRSEEDTVSLGDELVQRAKAGEDFASLVKEYSEDQTTKEQGGDLGFITRGQYTGKFGDQFDEAAFSLNIGETSDLVPLKNGYGIFQVYGRKEAYSASLEDPWQFHYLRIQLDDLDKAEEVLGQLKTGKDFTELAKSTSTDTTTASAGGDMGTVNRKSIESWELQVLLSLSPNEISDIVEHNGKFYIFKLVDEKTIYQVIEEQLLQEKQNQAWTDFIDDLKSKVEIITL